MEKRIQIRKEKRKMAEKQAINFMESIEQEKRLREASVAALTAGILQFLGDGFLYAVAAMGWFLNLFAVPEMDFKIWDIGWAVLFLAAAINLGILNAVIHLAVRNLAAGRRGEDGNRMKKRLLLIVKLFFADLAAALMAAGYVWRAAVYL